MEKPTVDPADKMFAFVRDVRLQAMLKRDAAELEACFDAGAWKAVLVLAGSLVEALLVDYFVAHGHPKKQPSDIAEMMLGPLIGLAHEEGVLTAESKDLSVALKNFRNLIHPGRELRLAQEATKQRAEIARALVAVIAEEIRRGHAKLGGPTTEYVIKVLEGDRTTISLVPSFVEALRPRERERLFRTLPSVVLAHHMNVRYKEAANLIEMHAALKKVVPAQVLADEVETIGRAVDKGCATAGTFIALFGSDLSLASAPVQKKVLSFVIGLPGTATLDDIAEFRARGGMRPVARHFRPEHVDEYATQLLKLWRAVGKLRTREEIVESFVTDLPLSVLEPLIADLKERTYDQKLADVVAESLIPF